MKDVLQVATRGGSGSAARILGSGLAGLTRRHKRVVIAATAAVTLAYLGWDLLAVTSTPASHEPPAAPVAVVDATPTPDAPAAVTDMSNRVSYSFDVDEIDGLSPTALPGTVVELWVTWDPPVVEQPKLQRVVKNAVVERISAPVTPDGPTVATFLIARSSLEDLLWADRYGTLSASTLPTTGAAAIPRS